MCVSVCCGAYVHARVSVCVSSDNFVCYPVQLQHVSACCMISTPFDSLNWHALEDCGQIKGLGFNNALADLVDLLNRKIDQTIVTQYLLPGVFFDQTD